MKVTGQTKLMRQLRSLPDVQRAHVVKAIYKNTEQGARVAKILAPNVTGETKDGITTQYKNGGMVGEVVVIDTAAPGAEKDRAYSIEHGRKQGDRGTTEGKKFVRQTRQYLGKKYRASIKRAVNKAAKEVARGG